MEIILTENFVKLKHIFFFFANYYSVRIIYNVLENNNNLAIEY